MEVIHQKNTKIRLNLLLYPVPICIMRVGCENNQCSSGTLQKFVKGYIVYKDYKSKKQEAYMCIYRSACAM